MSTPHDCNAPADAEAPIETMEASAALVAAVRDGNVAAVEAAVRGGVSSDAVWNG